MSKPIVKSKKEAAPVATEFKKTERQKGFAFGRENYRLMLIGLVVMVAGYILMIGGGSDDPNVFNGDQLFNFRRLTLAPIVILTGLVIELFAIMKKAKD
jgi:hypothetical protein